jgi:hydroxymethylbilane synthase
VFCLSQQKSQKTDVGVRFCQQGRRWPNPGEISRFILQRLRGQQLLRVRPLMTASIKIGTRGSRLALWQANWVKSALSEKFPQRSCDLVIIKTRGDKILDVPLAKVGGKGLFVKEIEQALLEKQIDIAVHSMKDMPAEILSGLCIGAFPQREDANDVLISRDNRCFANLKLGSTIGTSSLRRSAQLRHARPDIVIRPLRGNLDTRLQKLETGYLEGIVLAAAGVKRLGLEDRITECLPPDVMLPAVGQGALGIEIRANDPQIADMMAALDHAATRAAVLAERAFLKKLGGSCQIPIAGHASVNHNTVTLTALVADLDGSRIIKATLTGAIDSAEALGQELAADLLSMGADQILAKLQSLEPENYES